MRVFARSGKHDAARGIDAAAILLQVELPCALPLILRRAQRHDYFHRHHRSLCPLGFRMSDY